MLSGRDIVCFANDWSGDPLSKKHVMTRLAKRNRVLWVNSLGNRAPRASARDIKRIVEKLSKFASHLSAGPVEVAPNIHTITPLAIPNYRSNLARKVNELADFSKETDHCGGKFPVAADPGAVIAKEYDAPLVMAGKTVEGMSGRVSYVVSKDGKVVHTYDNLNPNDHVKETLAAVTKLNGGK